MIWSLIVEGFGNLDELEAMCGEVWAFPQLPEISMIFKTFQPCCGCKNHGKWQLRLASVGFVHRSS